MRLNTKGSYKAPN